MSLLERFASSLRVDQLELASDSESGASDEVNDLLLTLFTCTVVGSNPQSD